MRNNKSHNNLLAKSSLTHILIFYLEGLYNSTYIKRFIIKSGKHIKINKQIITNGKQFIFYTKKKP